MLVHQWENAEIKMVAYGKPREVMMSAESKRVAIYARVSTDEQAERDLSLPFQLERCRYYVQGKGWEVV